MLTRLVQPKQGMFYKKFKYIFYLIPYIQVNIKILISKCFWFNFQLDLNLN